MTKGAKRRNAYVSTGIWLAGAIAAVCSSQPWYVGAVVFALFFASLHELATVGFTSRSDNEE